MTHRNLAAIAGVVATAVGLGTAELLAGAFAAVPSPLDALGDQVVSALPGALVTGAIDALGAANRTVLVLGSLLVALGAGGLLGRVARSRSSAALVIVLVAAGLATWASLTRPDVSPPLVLLTMAAAVAVTLGTLRLLLARLGPVGPSAGAPGAVPTSVGGDRLATDVAAPALARTPATPDASVSPGTSPAPAAERELVAEVDRRRFLRLAGGFGASAVIAGAVGRGVLGRGGGSGPGTVSLPRPTSSLPPIAAGQDLAGQVSGLSPVLTPIEDFFRIDAAIALPRVDPETWTLRVGGLVERELEFSFDELAGRDLVEVDATISCVSNEVGGDLVGTARWLGVPLVELLEEAGPTAAAEQVVGRSVDGWTGGFPLEVALDGRDALVAIAMNGEALPVRHGFPARLVVPGLYGYVSATKWLEAVELTTWDGFDGYWVPRGWSKEGPVKTMSRIDVPVRDATVAAGDVTVAGVAWAPVRGIDRVEVQVDDGAWEPAQLADPLSAGTWVQWRLDRALRSGSHQLRVRAVDGDGDLQPEGPSEPAPDGAEGWHAVQVTVT